MQIIEEDCHVIIVFSIVEQDISIKNNSNTIIPVLLYSTPVYCEPIAQIKWLDEMYREVKLLQC